MPMEFAVSRQVLADELNKLQSIIPKKAVIQSLTMIKVESDQEGGIRLVATNLETTIFSQVTSKLLAVSVPGSMCIPAKRLIETLNLMKDGPVKITADPNDWLRVLAQGSSVKLPSMSPDSYPDTLTSDQLAKMEWVDIPTSHLKNMLPAVKYSIAGDEKQVGLRGAKLEVDSAGGEVRIITTDGHRISLASGKLTGLLTGDYDFLIPMESIDELTKLLGTKTDGSVGIASDENGIFFRIGSRILSTRRLASKFPSYQLPFSELGYQWFANFKADDLGRAIKMAMLCAETDTDKEKKRHSSVNLDFDSSKVIVRAQSPELGESSETLDSDYNGEPMTIAFNGRYLLDFLDPVGSGSVRFEIKDPNKQAYLIGERDGVTFYYCCMPMRQ